MAGKQSAVERAASIFVSRMCGGCRNERECVGTGGICVRMGSYCNGQDLIALRRAVLAARKEKAK